VLQLLERYYAFSKWPGKEGKLIDGYTLDRNNLKSLKAIEDWKLDFDDEVDILGSFHWFKKNDDLLRRRYCFWEPSEEGERQGASLEVTVWVAQEHCETVHWEIIRRFKSSPARFWRKEPWYTDIGDVNFRPSKSFIRFVRNNILVEIDANDDVPIDALQVAKEIDAQLLATKTYDSLEDSRHRPKILSFTADKYNLKPEEDVTYMPSEGCWTHLTVDAIDPMGGKLTYEFLSEPNDLGAVSRFEDEPYHFAVGMKEGTAKVTVLVANQRLLLSEATLEIEIKKDD
jgi:hypothetical protein